MFGLQVRFQLWLIADQAFTEARHWLGKRHHRHTADQVVENVEVDNQFGFRQRQLLHGGRQHVDKRQNNQATHQLKQQATQRHTAGGGVSGAVVEHGQQARTQVGANHQTQRHREGDDPGGGQRGGQQYGGQARVADNGKHGANQRIQQNITGQRRENHLHAVGLSDGCDRLHNQLQRQQNQPQADTHAAQLPFAGLLAAQEEGDADKNQQRRQPRKIESQDTRH